MELALNGRLQLQRKEEPVQENILLLYLFLRDFEK